MKTFDGKDYLISELLTTSELARAVGTKSVTLRQWVFRGQIRPVVTFNGTSLWHISLVDRLKKRVSERVA